MNSSTLLTLGFSLLLIISLAAGLNPPVVDYAGNPLKVRSRYYAWNVGRNRGAIGIGKTIVNSKCIHYVIDQRHDSGKPPVPIIFYPTNYSETIVRLGQDYNIQFDVEIDHAFQVWKINLDAGSPDHNFITTGGETGTPGCWNSNTWFQFTLANATDHRYKLVSNPQMCTRRKCLEEITFETRDGEDRLYLNQFGYLENNFPIELRFSNRDHTNLGIFSE